MLLCHQVLFREKTCFLAVDGAKCSTSQTFFVKGGHENISRCCKFAKNGNTLAEILRLEILCKLLPKTPVGINGHLEESKKFFRTKGDSCARLTSVSSPPFSSILWTKLFYWWKKKNQTAHSRHLASTPLEQVQSNLNTL